VGGTLWTPELGVVAAHGIVFDPSGGIGARRARRLHDDGALLAVAMRPAVFLQLATPLAAPRPSLEWILAALRAGRPICPPTLRVWPPPRPARGPGRGAPAAVVAHDGRHRATALRALLGEHAEVPVRLELLTLPAEEAVPGWALAALRAGMRAQGGARRLVPGPLFGAADVDAAGGRGAGTADAPRTGAPHRAWAPPPRHRRSATARRASSSERIATCLAGAGVPPRRAPDARRPPRSRAASDAGAHAAPRAVAFGLARRRS
jgi:hypothetical protein